MLCQIRIRLLTPCLGDRLHDRVLRFPRSEIDPSAWEIPFAEWQWLIQDAARALHLDKKIDCGLVFPPSKIGLPTVRMFRRAKGKAEPWAAASKCAVVDHEALWANTVITFEFAVPDCAPSPSGGAVPDYEGGEGVLPAPSLEQLEKMFGYIGAYIGISPWGKRHQKGRFMVLSIKDAMAPVSDNATPSTARD